MTGLSPVQQKCTKTKEAILEVLNIWNFRVRLLESLHNSEARKLQIFSTSAYTAAINGVFHVIVPASIILEGEEHAFLPFI